MDITETKPRISSINIIRGLGSAETIYFKEDKINRAETIKSAWLKTELINILRQETTAAKLLRIKELVCGSIVTRL
jgi:hypothetical protein